ncbi:MAG TPA: hypothetical protein VNX21_05385 [Candidatus Thermoplasmatota archaeon]|nr:hypothetical protein [Candidatus Thermoplasmatota archaeon]
MPSIPPAPGFAIASVLLLVLAPALVPLASGAALVTYKNGGEGPYYDDINDRGKHFSRVATGTITEVCAYGQAAGTHALLAVKPLPDASAPTFTLRIDITLAGAWNCVSRADAWATTTLFIYKHGGDAAIGYDAGTPHDSRYSLDGGASWSSDAWRRGYSVAILSSPAPTFPGSTTYANGGAGPYYDDHDYRGKALSGLQTGTVTRVCAFAETAETTLTVGLKVAADSLPPVYTVVVPVTQSADWSCAEVALPWTSSTMLIYKIAGTARVGYDAGTPYDSRYSHDSGLSWSSDAWRRGYSVSIAL